MAEITSALVQELREKTQAGMMDCKKALTEVNGDLEKAIKLLREKGLASAAKRSGRAASNGVIESYIHMNGNIGVLLEINCETDFVANTSEFRALARDVAMHIAAASPQCIRREEVPADLINKEKEILANQAKQEGKPEKMLEKITEGRIQKFYSEICLLEQPFVRDSSKSINELISESSAKFGENLVIKRFVRYQIGQE
jgi:elongation factor Ts